MSTEKARYISETVRDQMIAEALALAYDPSMNLGARAVIDAIAATMESIGDPLEKIWIEDSEGKRRTYKVGQAVTAVGDQPKFRYLWAIPESERGNGKSRWLTAATIDNMAANSATLFFAQPRGSAKEFVPHIALLKSLAHANVVPQYGFGYMREYGLGPDYFAVGYAFKSGARTIDQADVARLSAWSNDRAGKPAEHPDRYRHARGLILDVFPMNVLSRNHLRQKVGNATFEEWIIVNTGPQSLTQIDTECFVWFVPTDRTAAVSAQLAEFGLIIAAASKRVH